MYAGTRRAGKAFRPPLCPRTTEFLFSRPFLNFHLSSIITPSINFSRQEFSTRNVLSAASWTHLCISTGIDACHTSIFVGEADIRHCVLQTACLVIAGSPSDAKAKPLPVRSVFGD